METNRQKKINKLLQEEIGEIIRKMVQENAQNLLLTVTKVRISPDLTSVRTYVSVFPSAISATILTELKEAKALIRKQLGDNLHKHLRIIPELYFYIDDSLDYIENIEKELRGAGNNPKL